MICFTIIMMKDCDYYNIKFTRDCHWYYFYYQSQFATSAMMKYIGDFCEIGMLIVVFVLDFVIFANPLKTNRPKMMNIPRKLGEPRTQI